MAAPRLTYPLLVIWPPIEEVRFWNSPHNHRCLAYVDAITAMVAVNSTLFIVFNCSLSKKFTECALFDVAVVANLLLAVLQVALRRLSPAHLQHMRLLLAFLQRAVRLVPRTSDPSSALYWLSGVKDSSLASVLWLLFLAGHGPHAFFSLFFFPLPFLLAAVLQVVEMLISSTGLALTLYTPGEDQLQPGHLDPCQDLCLRLGGHAHLALASVLHPGASTEPLQRLCASHGTLVCTLLVLGLGAVVLPLSAAWGMELQRKHAYVLAQQPDDDDDAALHLRPAGQDAADTGLGVDRVILFALQAGLYCMCTFLASWSVATLVPPLLLRWLPALHCAQELCRRK